MARVSMQAYERNSHGLDGLAGDLHPMFDWNGFGLGNMCIEGGILRAKYSLRPVVVWIGWFAYYTTPGEGADK